LCKEEAPAQNAADFNRSFGAGGERAWLAGIRWGRGDSIDALRVINRPFGGKVGLV